MAPQVINKKGAHPSNAVIGLRESGHVGVIWGWETIQ
jgi:hypothetical protein